ncbi:DUF2970 domain-containing protein [Endozoicomonas sp. SCSIO W0465]|uniref:DUF2970 domain-containing protein n=1 Tax=Endozoicomonas sp. SCSIO W0465 TaxID=2918516 RepID=UPI0020754BCA|nr:DUF2970 domain-containing protein [Endozoicomonas sp. SCSIO W0465]USE39474.1 DUF2970 domain-containing protein [Endozoicomonas sp. SCSIO W0465]
MSDKKGTGIKSVILSTLSAAFGVQKRANLERDFQKGNPAHFIIAGIAGTVLLVLILIAVVHVVAQNS